MLDLTKPYQNLLGIENGKRMRKFFWDSNVAAMENERKRLHYYMQDELGSPLRVLHTTGVGEVYGYDEFGREVSSSGNYSRQGEKQPFGYTGYRYDVVGGTYFAQAREYQPAYGRFLAEDIRRGRAAVPKTRNRYGYCWNNPVGLVDLDGKEPEAPGVEIKLSTLIPQGESEKPQVSEEASVEEDFGDGITADIREATKDWNGVGLVSLTGSIGSGGYLSGGVQIAVDWHGNIEIYPVYGTGVQAGASGKFNVGVGFLAVPTAEDAKGFGLEVGGICRSGRFNTKCSMDNGK